MAAMMSERMSDPTPALSMDRSPPRQVPTTTTTAAGGFGSSSTPAGTPDRSSDPDRSPCTPRQLDYQNQCALRSKEYRQLFGLPEDEVHIQDFNCALQDNILLQGHMYLFSNYICFYANFLSYETKKVIPIHEITYVKRAKVAGLFPTAIEIATEEKKFFFASFLSREEAFKLINDGWSKTCDRVKSIIDHLEVQSREKIEDSVQENGRDVVEEAESSSRPSSDESDLSERNIGGHTCEELVLPAEADPEILSPAAGLQDNIEGDVEVVQNMALTSSSNPAWEEADCDAPEVPAGFMMVAETKFPIKVEEFFQFFFSNEAVTFQDSFHKKCGDKDFKCTEWCNDEKCGLTRDVSFQHPIKLYLGAKFGGCQEAQKYRVYRNCHLVVETSQEISDVPYGDYFHVEGLWHVKRNVQESKTGCVVKVYTNVNFSKKTMFKGKIVQSTIDECRDVFAIWMNLAHELLKQKKIEEASNLVQNDQVPRQKEVGTVACLEKPAEVTRVVQTLPSSNSGSGNAVAATSGRDRGSSLGTTLFSDCLVKIRSAMQVQSPVSLILVLGIALILILMQISILSLLSRPQQIQVIPQADWIHGNGMNTGTLGDRTSEAALLDRKIKNLKEEMQIFESLLERMRHEHASLKSRLTDLEMLRKRQK